MNYQNIGWCILGIVLQPPESGWSCIFLSQRKVYELVGIFLFVCSFGSVFIPTFLFLVWNKCKLSMTLLSGGYFPQKKK